MKLFHVHRDPRWKVRGVIAYYECKCGARRVHDAHSNLSGPVEPGWPRMVDPHGRATRDSGWVAA